MRAPWLVLLIPLISGCSKTNDAGGSSGAPATILHPARVIASSEHAADQTYTFGAVNIVDGALDTSWQPAPSDRAGQKWVRLEFDADVLVTSVAIANGFQVKDRYGDEFLLNRRLSTGRLRFGDGSEIVIQFADNVRGYVRFAVPRKTTRMIELRVDDTYPGTKWNDLAISEIEVTGVALAVVAVTAQPIAAATPPAEDTWWTPPPGERTSVEALAYGFAGIDEKDLGTAFTADLKPVYGTSNLFENRPPRRVPREGMEKLVIKLRNSSQFDGGFRWLFLKAGASYERDRDYQVVRAMQIKEVVRLDESARMRRPPEAAVFYLAEVHRGASYDLLVDGQRSAMGRRLELQFAQAGGSARHVHESGDYRLKAFGLGLRDFNGAGIFAMTPQQIAASYRTGDAVPVQLVFRTIPGRNYKPREYPVPVAVVDEPAFTVGENAWQSWTLPTGDYSIEATSLPNGCRPSWTGDVACDTGVGPRGEYTQVAMHCTVIGRAELTLTNPSTFELGPAETMSLYIERR